MKITKIVGYPLSSPYGDGMVLGQPLGVKSVGFVEVHTDNGMVGIGEAYSGIYAPDLIGPIIDTISGALIGCDPSDPFAAMVRANIPFISRHGLYMAVYSAIDIALWDIKSQYAEKPLYQVLGIKRENSPRLYASGGSAAFGRDELARDIEKIIAQGFQAFKMRVGFKSWQEDVARADFSRQCLGPDRDLMIDAIMGTVVPSWTVNEAREKIQKLAEVKPYWVEEPLHPDRVYDLVELRKDCPVRLAAGEALVGMMEYETYITMKAVDVIQVDVTHCGGITMALRILDLAMQQNIPAAMHVWGSAVGLQANMHVALAHPNVEWLEIPTVNLEMTSHMRSEKDLLRNGVLQKPIEAGLGIQISDSLKTKFPFVPGSGFKWKPS